MLFRSAPRTLFTVMLSVGGLLTQASWSSAQSYGLGDQVLVLAPATFRGLSSDTAFQTGGDGYLYPTGPAPANFLAPLPLPDGAEVFQMCIYGNVVSSSSVAAVIDITRQAAGGQGGNSVGLPDSLVTDNVAIGYGTTCTSTFSYVLHDADGGFNLAHSVAASSVNGAGFGGLRISWRRQVSAPPATPTFGDVPATDPFFPYVEALVASGITAGCGNGNYCPDSPLTRRQMAAFLSKALGLHWPN